MNDLLFEKYCSGTLSPGEMRDLKSELATLDGRRAMARHLEERSILIHLCSRRTRRRTATRPAPPSRAPWILAAAAAAAVILGLLADSPTPLPKPAPRPEVVVVIPSAPPPAPPPPPKPLVVEPSAPLVGRRFEAAAPKEPERPMTIASVAVVEGTGQALPPGAALSTAPTGSAVIRYPDGTRIELLGSTSIRDLDRSGFFLAEGTIAADVAKRDRPFIAATARGTATVLGTSFRLSVARLDVTEGRVRLTRAGDGKSVEVGADQYAEVDDLVVHPTVEAFDRMPSWGSTYHAKWGGPAAWSLGAGRKGTALLASRPGRGSSVSALVFRVPAGSTVELSAFMKCPTLQGRTWMELGYRLGDHRASEFDTHADRWTVVKKFDGAGSGGEWMRVQALVETGKSTSLTVAFKIGSHDGGAPTVGWDELRIAVR